MASVAIILLQMILRKFSVLVIVKVIDYEENETEAIGRAIENRDNAFYRIDSKLF